MKDDDGFETIFSVSLKDGGSMSMSFPIPKEAEPFVLSVENNKRAIEYYLLARYAFLHEMHSSFMINSFWAVEHLILSILILRIKDKEELKRLGGFHSITDYWQEAKAMLPGEKSTSMSKFDNYIGKVKGYFSERYPEIATEVKLTHTRKSPRVVPGDDKNSKVFKFGKVAHISLDELDHFVNFMLHDITSYGDDFSRNLMALLESQDNIELYKKDNKYSIVYPNKIYNGERITSTGSLI